MAKTAKAKVRAPSLHSRAAKRASSPSLNLDKSVKNLPRAQDDKDDVAVTGLSSKERMEKKLHEISLRSGAGDTFSGVSKNKKGKALSMKQRRRKEMGMEKALQASERLVKKVEGSKKRAGMVAERRNDWSDLNNKIEVPIAALANALELAAGGAQAAVKKNKFEAGLEPPAPLSPIASPNVLSPDLSLLHI